MTTQSTSTLSPHAPALALVAERLAAQGLDSDAVELVAVFGRFGPAYQRRLAAQARRDGLSLARMKLLWALRTHGPQQMSVIKERLRVTARNVTQLVDALEAEDLVRRTPHPSDRRAIILELTDRAFSVLDESFVAHTADVARLFQLLPHADRVHLLRIIPTLTAHLERAGGGAACDPAATDLLFGAADAADAADAAGVSARPPAADREVAGDLPRA
ncbi:MAG: MarR family winged helix-turn-helix transcriptional regulator [Kineosporiaceae bacterium]